MEWAAPAPRIRAKVEFQQSTLTSGSAPRYIELMAAAARVSPRTFFTAQEWAPLSVRSSWKGLVLVAHAWGVIGAASVMAIVWPVTIPLAVVIP